MQIKTLFPIIFFGIFFATTAVLFFNGRRELEDVGFNGKIEKLVYDEKNIATVTVKGISYHLTPLRKEFKAQVRIGDVIKKAKGASTYTILKENSSEIIKFDF